MDWTSEGTVETLEELSDVGACVSVVTFDLLHVPLRCLLVSQRLKVANQLCVVFQ